jgi:hypothetical protein
MKKEMNLEKAASPRISNTKLSMDSEKLNERICKSDLRPSPW